MDEMVGRLDGLNLANCGVASAQVTTENSVILRLCDGRQVTLQLPELLHIKNCPCCGKPADLWENPMNGRMVISCSECGLSIEKDTQEEVIEAWNKRVI